MKEILITAAKEDLTKKIKAKLNNEKWTECFDAAEELIDSKTKPTVAESQVMNQLLMSVSSSCVLLAANCVLCHC